MQETQILWITNTSVLAKEVIKLHTHDYYHLLLAKSGRFTFSLNGTPHSMKRGDLIIAPTGVAHSIYDIETDYIEVQEIKFLVLSRSLNSCLLQLAPEPIRDETASVLVESVVDEYMAAGVLADSAAPAYLNALLYHITRDVRHSRGEHSLPGAVSKPDYPDTVERVIEYIERNYGKDMSLDEIAAYAGANKSYMCSLFKKSTSFTVGEWINIVRVHKAAGMIVYSDLSLAQIARSCGYVSATHFNRVFHKYTGISPGKYRRAYPVGIHENMELIDERPHNNFLYSVLAHKHIDQVMMKRGEKSGEER